MTTYLSLTIGPIYKTIERARKTRELWASSFLLSQFMRSLLEQLQLGKYGEALSPDLTELGSKIKHHGAGIWNDNCYFKIFDSKVDDLKEKLPEIVRKAKNEILNLVLLDFKEGDLALSDSQLRAIVSLHFHCHAALLQYNETDSNRKPILQELRGLTISTEMRDLYPPKNDDFVSSAMFRKKSVEGLYELGFEPSDDVFTYYTDPFDTFITRRRLPSLLEIGLREFKKDEQIYQKVKNVITEKIKTRGEDETDEENQEIIKTLKEIKDKQKKSVFKKRHKYVAIVQSDGDGVGNLISGQKDDAIISLISKELMAFSTGAVEEIYQFDALPVYAGGDDLLFISPIQNKHGETVFDLLEKIKREFDKQKLIKSQDASLSFGVSIFYYKYPLGEALENGRLLLNKLAKKLAFQKKERDDTLRKNGLSFRVMLHAGQSFATVLRQDGAAWKAWKALLAIYDKSASKDQAFVSGVIHTLERLGFLLEKACATNSAEAFFDHHFNEAKGTPRWDFIKNVRVLAEAIYSDYKILDISVEHQETFFKSQFEWQGDTIIKTTDADKLRQMYCNNLLYSTLRMIQFLNAEDHE